MNKEFIPYEQALELKQLGFDEPCYSYYFIYEDRLRQDFADVEYDYENRQEVLMPINGNKDSPKEYAIAPLYQQAFRWFREKYQITSEVLIEQYRRRTDKKWMFSITYLTEDAMYEHSKTTFISYEEAELACLKKLIEIVKNK